MVLECAPPKLYGFCSSWALQVATGVYVANLPAKTREQIWEQVVEWATEDTRAMLVWDSRGSEQGLEHRVLGSPRRTITEREGLLISTWIPLSKEDAIGPEDNP